MNAKIKLQTLEKNLKIWAPLLTITYFGLTSWSFLQQRQLIQYQFRYLFIMLAVASIFGLIRIFKLFRSNLALTTLVLIPTALLFCLSSTLLLWFPRLLTKEQLGNKTYYMLAEPELFDAHTILHLYQCERMFICQKTSFTQRDPSQKDFHIIGGASNDEVNIVATFLNGKELMVYTHGRSSRYYVDFGELNSKIYYLAREDDDSKNQTSKYSIVRCDANNRSCENTPFHYQTEEFSPIIVLEIDEFVNELRVLNLKGEKDILIYVYGDNPFCYVEGCEVRP